MVDEEQMRIRHDRCRPRRRPGAVRRPSCSTIGAAAAPLLVKKQVVLTGDRITDAQPGFDQQTGEPAVHDRASTAQGARIFQQVTRENVSKRMAILLFEKGKGEVRHRAGHPSGDSGGRVQITGRMTHHGSERRRAAAARRRARRADGHHRGAHGRAEPRRGQHQQGFHSTLDRLRRDRRVHDRLLPPLRRDFGARARREPAVAGRAAVDAAGDADACRASPAIALTLGMAIDANVLINERIREELRNGNTPQAAIAAGYERAWGTILDSNVTTLIAGLALFVFGSGPVAAFAVVHCLGILTSMFSAVMVSRGIVNLIYGSVAALETVADRQMWSWHKRARALHDSRDHARLLTAN